MRFYFFGVQARLLSSLAVGLFAIIPNAAPLILVHDYTQSFKPFSENQYEAFQQQSLLPLKTGFSFFQKSVYPFFVIV